MPPPETLDRIFRVPLRSLFGGFEAVGSAAGLGYDWSAVDVPVLHWTGWYDYTYRDALDAYARLSGGKRHAKDQRLVVGAWMHNGEFAPSVKVGGVDFGPAAAAGPDVRRPLEFKFEVQRPRHRFRAGAVPEVAEGLAATECEPEYGPLDIVPCEVQTEGQPDPPGCGKGDSVCDPPSPELAALSSVASEFPR